MTTDYTSALVGGGILGFASLIMLYFNGKILGISGIIGGLLQKTQDSKQWRLFFFLGMLTGGLILRLTYPTAFQFSLSRSPWAIIAAGLLVGFGTRLGSGCTSGHGICGISRFSPRSLIATLTFMVFGAITVFIINHFLHEII